MGKKWVTLATTALMIGAMAPQMTFASTAPAPTLHQENYSGGNAGNWYTGAIPPNVDNNLPVIVFVQGLHSDYTTWTAGDDYYDAAYNAGYRTAFVQLTDADGTGGDPYTNGSMLATQLQEIASYYNVPYVNVIAHSKGGIDTQTALDYYGAYNLVDTVITLSTPYDGSELADMSYSTWTWWLGAIMGQHDPAVYSLQTSWMQNYRNDTDPMSENNYTTYWMADGTGDDGWFSATWYAHAVLPGSDDGAVADYSATGYQYGWYIFTDDGSTALSHSMMHDASHTWWQTQPYLDYGYNVAVANTNSMISPTVATTSTSSSHGKNMTGSNSKNTNIDETSNSIMRGGQINGTATDTFTLESGLNNAAIDVMTSSSATKVTLISPSGKVYAANQVAGQNTDGSVLFANAVHNQFALPTPEKGTWTVQATGNNDAYFMLANLDGGAQAHIKGDKKVHSINDPSVSVNLSLDNAKLDAKHLKNAKLTKANKFGKGTPVGDVQAQLDSNGNLTSTLATPSVPGIYNLSFDITGTNAKGETFTRSVNYNFAVTDANGKLDN